MNIEIKRSLVVKNKSNIKCMLDSVVLEPNNTIITTTNELRLVRVFSSKAHFNRIAN